MRAPGISLGCPITAIFEFANPEFPECPGQAKGQTVSQTRAARGSGAREARNSTSTLLNNVNPWREFWSFAFAAFESCDWKEWNALEFRHLRLRHEG
jgi:hypothetical protein